jgi:hypothetical protein
MPCDRAWGKNNRCIPSSQVFGSLVDVTLPFHSLIGFHAQDYVLEKGLRNGQTVQALRTRVESEPCRGWCREWELVAASSGRARENCNSEDYPGVESVHTRRRVVRDANDLLTQLRRQGWTVLHGLFDACGNRVPLSDP